MKNYKVRYLQIWANWLEKSKSSTPTLPCALKKKIKKMLATHGVYWKLYRCAACLWLVDCEFRLAITIDKFLVSQSGRVWASPHTWKDRRSPTAALNREQYEALIAESCGRRHSYSKWTCTTLWVYCLSLRAKSLISWVQHFSYSYMLACCYIQRGAGWS